MLVNILVIGRYPDWYKVHRNSSKSLILFPGRGISFWCFSLKSDSSNRLNTGELSVNSCLCTCSLKPSTTRRTSDGHQTDWTLLMVYTSLEDQCFSWILPSIFVVYFQQPLFFFQVILCLRTTQDKISYIVFIRTQMFFSVARLDIQTSNVKAGLYTYKIALLHGSGNFL